MNIVTKTFIVLTFVFAIALAVVVPLTMNDVSVYKRDLEAANMKASAAQAALALEKAQSAAAQDQVTRLTAAMNTSTTEWQSKVESARKDAQTLQAQLDSQTTRVDELTAATRSLTVANEAQTKQLAALKTEIDTIRPDYTKTIERNQELVRANAELTNRLDLAGKSIRSLQEELATVRSKVTETQPKTANAGDKAVPAGVPTAVQVNGKVVEVAANGGKTFVTLNLGSRDGVKVGNSFMIYRGNTYVGDAVVQRVTPDASVAQVTITQPGQVVQSTDLVISGGM